MSHHLNKVRIKAVARALKELNDDVVYIGGASISLYADEIKLPDHRPTEDIDIIIEMASYAHYSKIHERLRALGFKEDAESEVICRWKIEGIIVDIMPLKDQVLGFTNPWYEKSFSERIKITLDDVEIHILPVHLLILTKWEALLNRKGGVDWRWSHDFEDIIKVMLATDQWHSPNLETSKLKVEFAKVLALLLADEAFFYEACRAQLNANFYSNDSIVGLIEMMKKEIDE